MRKKKKLILSAIIISIILTITIVVISLNSTNALFANQSTSTRKYNYNTGLLSITAISQTETISLDNTLPMSDADGILQDPYVFTIKNNGNVDYQFDIQLLATNANTFDSQYIKLKIDNDEATTLSALTNSKIKTGITLRAQESMDISLRVWLSNATPNSQIGKSFTSQLVISGIAAQTSSNYGVTAAAYITSLYNNATKTEVTNNNIKYNYATSVSLMNDRLGGTTKDLNAGNIRYYGASPDNYIYFNCSDYNNQDNNTCEKWRIIGVFDNMVKIIRDESIGTYSWDTSVEGINSGYGINEWSQADLMKLLNPGYDDNKLDGSETIKVNNSLYWNATNTGKCLDGANNNYKNCYFSTSGLKNDLTRNRIATVSWNLGGISSASYFPNEFYAFERGINHVSNPDDGVDRQDIWMGKIALMYPSDYGYATNFNFCNKVLDEYDSSEDSYGCSANNWLYSEIVENTISSTTVASEASKRYFILLSAKLGANNASADNHERPVLFLNSEEVIKGGDGSSSTPYQLR